MYAGQKYIRDNLIEQIKEIAESDKASAELKAAFDKSIETTPARTAQKAPRISPSLRKCRATA